jgi:hypothetical protein
MGLQFWHEMIVCNLKWESVGIVPQRYRFQYTGVQTLMVKRVTSPKCQISIPV